MQEHILPTSDNSDHKYIVLEKLTQTNLITITPGEEYTKLETCSRQIGSSQENTPIGILVPVLPASGFVLKLISIIRTARMIHKIKGLFEKKYGIKLSTYSVYPDIMNPVAIIQQHTMAEYYAYKNIYPGFNKGISGFLRLLIS